MLTPDQISELHRLHWVEKWPLRKIARHLRMGRRTIAKYLHAPAARPARRERARKIDPWKDAIGELLTQDPDANAPVIAQRLKPFGFDGGLTIVKDYLRTLRKNSVARRAYVRVEPAPGERFDVDWAHFGALVYNGAMRKLYAFCLVESHSRRMYLEFTHSQTFETFARCHVHAFHFFSGVSREIWFDNLASAVAEHDGNLVRFNPRFLAFARECDFIPRACHVRAPWEKGKVERAIGYVRRNFWPLRSFVDLADVNAQARQWLKEVANQRQHRETGEKPDQRFQPESLRPLPAMMPDYRDSATALVHKDIRLAFDGNRYCVPPRYVGEKLTIKADSSSLTIYDQHHEVATYARSWQRGQVLGADRFERELRAQMAAAERSATQQRLIALLGPAAHEYLERLATTDRSLSRQIRELFMLVREYGPEAVAAAVATAHAARAFGADYVANILRQQRQRRDVQPPLQLRDPALNQLATDPLSLAEYDAFILHSRKESRDRTASETQSAQLDLHGVASGSDDR